MRRSISNWVSAVAAGLVLTLGLTSACSKSNSKPKDGAAITAKIAGASEANSALQKKDYDALLTALGTASAAIASETDQAEFRKLTNEVLDALRLVRDQDPKAAEAFQAVRVMVMGR
jgi:hypothetical protein